MRLDLNQPRDLGQLIGATFRLYWHYFLPFAGIALTVVLPLDLLLNGVMLEQLWSYDATPPFGLSFLALFATNFFGVPLVTAMHVSAVMDVGSGHSPSVSGALRRGFAVFLPLALTLTAMWLGLLVGFALLIIPGVYLYIRWYVVPQAVVVDDRRFADALERSTNLIEGSWWRVAGIVIVLTTIISVAVGIVAVPIQFAADTAESGPLLLAGTIIADTASISFNALTATLIYFDLRARRSGVLAGTPPTSPPPAPPARPEDPSAS